MNRMNQMLAKSLTATCLALLMAGCGDDEGPPIDGPETVVNPFLAAPPECWRGTWEFSYTERDCLTGEIVDSETYTEMICADSWIMPEDNIEGASFVDQCSFQMDCEKLVYDCGWSWEYEGCSVDVVVSMNGVKQADSFQGTAEMTLSSRGDCGIDSECVQVEISAVRVGSAPASCNQQTSPAAAIHDLSRRVARQ